jgi:protein-tyrosine phosphatase
MLNMIEDFVDRHHPFEGCFNFRDIGGYQTDDGRRIRWGRYFRAGRQDRMTANDLAAARQFSIQTQIDLRRIDEVEDQGRGPLETIGADYIHLPVIPEGGSDQLTRLVGDTGISGRRYLGYLDFGPQTWQRLFELLADAARHPVLVHCTAGKDRTGVSTAFLLSVLGVRRELIEADYCLTNRDVARQVDFIQATTGFPDGVDRAAMMGAAGVPVEAMGDFLDGLDTKFGGVVGYLRSIGITETVINAVRGAFLET